MKNVTVNKVDGMVTEIRDSWSGVVMIVTEYSVNEVSIITVT